MNRPRDSKGRYVRTSSQYFVKIPTNLYGGRATPTANSTERHQRIHEGTSPTWKPKKTLSGNITRGAIEGRETLAGSSKDPISKEFQEG